MQSYFFFNIQIVQVNDCYMCSKGIILFAPLPPVRIPQNFFKLVYAANQISFNVSHVNSLTLDRTSLLSYFILLIVVDWAHQTISSPYSDFWLNTLSFPLLKVNLWWLCTPRGEGTCNLVLYMLVFILVVMSHCHIVIISEVIIS